jgi:hypothetical protein
MKNPVFWDMKTHSVPHEKHIKSPLQSPTGYCYIRFYVITAVTMKWRLLGCKNLFRTSRETHYISAIEPNRLLLCKIWGLHGSEYEECRLLGYKNPVRTSLETHHIFATDPSRLMLCDIKNAVIWDLTQCGSCKDRRFGGTWGGHFLWTCG